MKRKQFKDSVHGYISVDAEYCSSFIDTDIFQRLRHIEQTSMRVLFPSAHHDRFIHSLGVFHLGGLAFTHLYENAKSCLDDIGNDDWERYKVSFLTGCLLHDCAHAPFSHTFEHYYDYQYDGVKNYLANRLCTVADDERFLKDYRYCSPKPHEAASAVVVLEQYSNEIRSFGGDPLLVARMITGCLYRGAQGTHEQFENCLVSLLNSKAIDVDKLDYIIRDTWASGVHNVTIDVERLLKALSICPISVMGTKKLSLVFNKSALSVLQNIVRGRNFLYEWMYSHHTVQYEVYLLENAVREIAERLCPDDPDEFFSKFFSIDALSSTVTVADHDFYLPTDGDLVYLLKCYRKTTGKAKEWLSRRYERMALWKTYAEFQLMFERVSSDRRKFVRKEAAGRLNALVKDCDCEVVLIDVKPSIVVVEQADIFVEIADGEVQSYRQVFQYETERHFEEFFYIYVPRSQEHRLKDYLNELRKLY